MPELVGLVPAYKLQASFFGAPARLRYNLHNRTYLQRTSCHAAMGIRLLRDSF